MRIRTIAVLGILAACGAAAPPAANTRTAAVPTEWPGVAWERAEAVLFNQVPYGPEIETHALRAWDPAHGMNPSIVERKPIDASLANRAIALVNATGGRVDVSKCAFPRHAIVFYRGDQPVASVNVCFACGDILISPDPRPSLDDLTDSQLDAAIKADEARMVRYAQVYPKWQALFRDDIGFSIVPPLRARHE